MAGMGGNLTLCAGQLTFAGQRAREMLMRDHPLEFSAYLNSNLSRHTDTRISESGLLNERPTTGSAVPNVRKVGSEKRKGPAVVRRSERNPRSE